MIDPTPIDEPLGFDFSHTVEQACPEAPTKMADLVYSMEDTFYDYPQNSNAAAQPGWMRRHSYWYEEDRRQWRANHSNYSHRAKLHWASRLQKRRAKKG